MAISPCDAQPGWCEKSVREIPIEGGKFPPPKGHPHGVRRRVPRGGGRIWRARGRTNLLLADLGTLQALAVRRPDGTHGEVAAVLDETIAAVVAVRRRRRLGDDDA